jgi:serine/threonine protein kinase
MSPSVGDRFGRFALAEVLGRGGNGTVWLGRAGDGSEAAIKILRSDRLGSEPLGRFRDEVVLLRRLAGRAGIVPLLDANIAVEPSPLDLPWLAMPVGEPLSRVEALTLTDAVAAICSVASALADLHEEGIHHRDLKPANILRVAGAWVVSDFGLAAFPDREGLTVPGEKLGPLFYIAPEMLSGRAEDFGPADVFSLAKTLWVMATGQRYPMPGELLPEFAGARLSSYVKGHRADLAGPALVSGNQDGPDAPAQHADLP